jgi:hypothetical protein
MIRYITLLTVTLLLTVACSGGADTETAEVATSAPTATLTPTQATPTSTPTPSAYEVPALPPPTPTSTSTPVTPSGLPQVPASCVPIPTQMASTEASTVAEHYRNIGYNKPFYGMAQEIVVASDVPQEVVDEWCEIQRNLNETIGSYNRYIMLITTDNEHSQAVFNKLKEVHWYGPLRIENGRLVDAGCLTGSGDWNVTPPDPYGLCIMDYEFIQYPHDTKEWDSPKPKRQAIIYHGWAHEYFHRYQRAYHLDLNMGTEEVGTPAWWIEGAAIIFPNIWLKNNWQDLSAFRGLSFSDVDVEGIDLDRWYRDMKRAAHGVSHQDDRCNGYVFGPAEERYETMRCFLGMANAYLAYLTSYQTLWVDIPMDIYKLGFENSFQKHTNMTLQEFYDQFNAFLRQGDPNDPPPAGFFPEVPISEYVNFPSP